MGWCIMGGVKELVANFKTIYHKDRKVLIWMIVLVLMGAGMILVPVVNLNPAVLRTWVRYSDINSGYAEGNWWYLLSFSVLGLVMSVGHCLLAARLYAKRGASVAMMFLVVSIAMIVVAMAFLVKILGRG